MNSFPQYVRVIVDQNGPEEWSASFADSPGIVAEGMSPGEAVDRLISLVGASNLDVSAIAAIEDSVRDDDFEFRIPFLNLKTIPIPSIN